MKISLDITDNSNNKQQVLEMELIDNFDPSTTSMEPIRIAIMFQLRLTLETGFDDKKNWKGISSNNNT